MHNEKYKYIERSDYCNVYDGCGCFPAKEAYDFINQQNIQSVVFGASSKNHIEETINLIKLS